MLFCGLTFSVLSELLFSYSFDHKQGSTAENFENFNRNLYLSCEKCLISGAIKNIVLSALIYGNKVRRRKKSYVKTKKKCNKIYFRTRPQNKILH